MAELTKIMLVEDDPIVCDSFRAAARHLPDLTITYETGSERQALGYLETHKVDVVILLKIDNPFITVVTNNASVVTLNYMREHGADYIYQKHNISYSPEKVLSIIRKICPYQKVMKVREEPLMNGSLIRERDEEIKRRYVEDEQKKMGFKQKQV